MNISYFPNHVARNGTDVIQAFLHSCKQRGITPVENSNHADMAVIWSVLWHGRMSANQQIYKHYRDQGKPVVVIDAGTLQRGKTWKVALNHITRDGYYGHTVNLDSARPQKLGLKLIETISSNPAILIAAQHQQSLQTQNILIEQWIKQQIDQLKKYTDRPVIVRPHPRCRLNLSLLPGINVQTPRRLLDTYDNFDFSVDYHAVVNYNSGPGIQAALFGIRPVVSHSSLAYPVAVDVKNIEQSYSIDRQQWLIEISHTEYTVEEIQQGLCLTRLGL